MPVNPIPNWITAFHRISLHSNHKKIQCQVPVDANNIISKQVRHSTPLSLFYLQRWKQPLHEASKHCTNAPQTLTPYIPTSSHYPVIISRVIHIEFHCSQASQASYTSTSTTGGVQGKILNFFLFLQPFLEELQVEVHSQIRVQYRDTLRILLGKILQPTHIHHPHPHPPYSSNPHRSPLLLQLTLVVNPTWSFGWEDTNTDSECPCSFSSSRIPITMSLSFFGCRCSSFGSSVTRSLKK